ncbi:uncharacterized protein LOC134814026 isoform X2 [Bolinopsis microptera]|uniref:uncharacterized protein LOC134814026 isoform X1 n=1 Tax=Bolinopsis microptera TaxID=2820187 RepID=UPI003078CC56
MAMPMQSRNTLNESAEVKNEGPDSPIKMEIKTEEEELTGESHVFICPKCEAHFLYESYFIEHIETHHEDIKLEEGLQVEVGTDFLAEEETNHRISNGDILDTERNESETKKKAGRVNRRKPAPLLCPGIDILQPEKFSMEIEENLKNRRFTWRLNGVFTALKERWGGNVRNIDRNDIHVRDWLYCEASNLFMWSQPLPEEIENTLLDQLRKWINNVKRKEKRKSKSTNDSDRKRKLTDLEDTIKELQAKLRASLLENMQRMGEKITKDVGTQTSHGCDYVCAGSENGDNEEMDYEAGSCDEDNENDNIVNAVTGSDSSEQEKAMKLPGERGKTKLLSNSYSSSSTKWNLRKKRCVETDH